MAKYSEEFKLKVVRGYLDGPLGYRLLAKKYNIPSATPIKGWVNSYKAFGMGGLQNKRSKKDYSVQFKLDVLLLMKKKCLVKNS